MIRRYWRNSADIPIAPLQKVLEEAGFKTKLTPDQVPFDLRETWNEKPRDDVFVAELTIIFENDKMSYIYDAYKDREHKIFHLTPNPWCIYEKIVFGNSVPKHRPAITQEMVKESAIEYLGYIFHTPRLRLKTLTIDTRILGRDCDYKYAFGSEKLNFAKDLLVRIGVMLSKVRWFVHVDKLLVRTNHVLENQELAAFLPFIDPRGLKLIAVHGAQNLINKDLHPVSSTEQWQAASLLLLENVSNIKKRDVCHANAVVVWMEVKAPGMQLSQTNEMLKLIRHYTQSKASMPYRFTCSNSEDHIKLVCDLKNALIARKAIRDPNRNGVFYFDTLVANTWVMVKLVWEPKATCIDISRVESPNPPGINKLVTDFESGSSRDREKSAGSSSAESIVCSRVESLVLSGKDGIVTSVESGSQEYDDKSAGTSSAGSTNVPNPLPPTPASFPPV